MAEDAARERVDVVVLDAGAVPTVAALEAARFEAMNPSVGMVLVSDSVGREHPSTPGCSQSGVPSRACMTR